VHDALAPIIAVQQIADLGSAVFQVELEQDDLANHFASTSVIVDGLK